MSINPPKESEGLGCTAGGLPFGPPSFIAPTPGVTDEAADLVDDFTPTKYELAVLARHYAEKKNQIDFDVWVLAQVGSSDWRFSIFADRRLDALLQCLGKQEFEAEVGPIQQHWDDKYADAQEACVRCTQCGVLFKESEEDPCPVCEAGGTVAKDLDANPLTGS